MHVPMVKSPLPKVARNLDFAPQLQAHYKSALKLDVSPDT